MPTSYTSSDINLVPPNAAQTASLAQRLFRLVIRQGKAIIIITEAIVLLVFLSRFKLDRDIADLQENIDNKEAIISSSVILENEYKRIQNKTQKIETFLDNQIGWEERLSFINSITPQGSVLEATNFTGNKLNVNAKVTTAEAFGLFISKLSNSDTVQSVILKSSSYDTKNEQYTFSMDIKLLK